MASEKSGKRVEFICLYEGSVLPMWQLKMADHWKGLIGV
jgi:hypothetical protein